MEAKSLTQRYEHRMKALEQDKAGKVGDVLRASTLSQWNRRKTDIGPLARASVIAHRLASGLNRSP